MVLICALKGSKFLTFRDTSGGTQLVIQCRGGSMPRCAEFHTPNRRSERLPLEGKAFLSHGRHSVDFYCTEIVR